MKVFADKKRFRRYKARAAALPAGWRAAIEAVERYVYIFGPGRADDLLPMLDDLVEVFEQSAADGTRLRDVVGDDPVEFVETFLAGYPTGQWIQRERDRLTREIAVAAGDAR